MSPADDTPKDEEINDLEGAIIDETHADEAAAAQAAQTPEADEPAPVDEPGEGDEPEAEEPAEAAVQEPVAVQEPAVDPAPEDEAPGAQPKRGRTKQPAEPVAAAKPSRRKATPSGERPVVRAHAKYVRTSARKARLVCDHIRGKDVTEARAILAHAPRAVAADWAKLLESAVANAEHNHELLGDDLRILSVTADEGPTLKRFRPRAMGRASAIRKRTSHLTIALTPKEQ